MQESKCASLRRRQRRPPRLRRLEQNARRDDIGVDERSWANDRTVDMRLRREVDDRARTMLREQRRYERAITDAPANKNMSRVIRGRCQIAEIAGIRERVEIDKRFVTFCKPVEDEVGADEPGAAGDDNHRGGELMNAAAILAVEAAIPLDEARESRIERRERHRSLVRSAPWNVNSEKAQTGGR